MRKTIDPLVGGAVLLLVVLVAVGAYFLMNRTPPPLKATDVYSKAVLADPDPPRPGQPGYRQRTTDVPLGADGKTPDPNYFKGK
jgi:hypothetical protein